MRPFTHPLWRGIGVTPCTASCYRVEVLHPPATFTPNAWVYGKLYSGHLYRGNFIHQRENTLCPDETAIVIHNVVRGFAK